MVRKEHDFLHYLKTGDMELTADLGIPTMNGIKFKRLSEPDMVGFNYATASKLPDGRQKKDNIVHFFLADYVFEPFMRTEKPFAQMLHIIVGMGAGSGMAVMSLCTGLFGAIFSFISYHQKVIRNLDTE